MSIFTNTDNIEVYSTTGFKDLLESRVFYAVLLITFVLGFFSILGFIQSPLKLKAVVDNVSKQVSTSPYSSTRINESSPYSLSEKTNNSKQSNKNRYQIFSFESLSNSRQQTTDNIQHISFDYDITSKQFWRELDSVRIESTNKKNNIAGDDGSFLGTPLESDYYLKQGSFKYSLRDSLKLRILRL